MHISQEGMTLMGGSSYSVGQQHLQEKSTTRIKQTRESNEVKHALHYGEIVHNHYTLDSNKDLVVVQGGQGWKAHVKVSKSGSPLHKTEHNADLRRELKNETQGGPILLRDQVIEDCSDASNKYFYQTINQNNTSSLSPKP